MVSSQAALDAQWMRQALALAARGMETTTPNPRVGCLIVRDGEIVGSGWHVRAGEPHAEVHALREAGEQARGATAYVTLEPCSHHGRTPPCADALLAAGLSRVVVAMQDPNPLVAGRGLQRLRDAGVDVVCGVHELEALELNCGFVSRMRRQRPWVRVKMACSLDGRTALANGESQWITGEAARQEVQQWRARSCAVLSGSGTILSDDAALTVRTHADARQPLRVICDSQLRTPVSARLLQTPGVLLVHAQDNAQRAAALQQAGAETLLLAAGNRVDLSALLAELARRGCNEVLVEAGATLCGALLTQNLVDEIVLYQAPMLLGDPARGVAELELSSLSQAIRPRLISRHEVGQDICLRLLCTEFAALMETKHES